MASPATHQPKGPATWVKVLVSLVILWQFSMIATAVTSAGSANFPPPPAATYVSQRVATPYLKPLFLTSPYRYYAPNPGPTDVLWYRLEYQNGGARWLDPADRQSFFNRMPYQRHMALSMMIEQMAVPDPLNPTQKVLSPQAIVSVKSYARHIAGSMDAVDKDGQPSLVTQVDIYHISHAIAEPIQLRLGWSAYDIRLHRATFVGGYDRTGKRVDIQEGEPQFQVLPRPISKVAGQIIEETRDLIQGYSGKALQERLEDLRLPVAIRELFEQFPQLAEYGVKEEPLAELLRELVESRDNQELKRNANPVLLLPIQW